MQTPIVQNFFKYKGHHIGLWLAAIVFWFATSNRTWQHESIDIALTLIRDIPLGYTIIYLLYPRFYLKRKYSIFVFWVVLANIAAASYTVLAYYTCFKLGWLIPKYSTEAWPYWVKMFFLTFGGEVVFSSFFLMVKMLRMNMLEVQRNDQAEKEKTRSELMFLKAQMNPHVLFNSINSIYALIIRDPKLAANTLVKFSDMLRYQLYECNVDEVPISKEIAYLSHYIDFEKMRKNRLIVNFNVSESCANFQLAPLLMIPFVENAFKFVSDHFEHPNSIDIELDLQGKTFIFLVKNTTQSEYKIAQELKVGGIGLTNVKRRLALIYSGLHELSIKSEHEEFEIKLQIIIKT